MQFWVTKNAELPVREQLVRQVVLGILSEELPAGHKLPSVRTVARQLRIHSNTVSGAYHHLLEQGWLELRRGSGLYVRSPNSSPGRYGELDRLLTALLQSAQASGYEAREVLHRLEYLSAPRSYDTVLIVEPDPAMREILQAELSEQVGKSVRAVERVQFKSASELSRTLVVTRPTRSVEVRSSLPDGVVAVPLRIRSLSQALEGQLRPSPDTIVAVISRSPEIRGWARAMLVSVGVDPDSLCEIDASSADWKSRVPQGALFISDIVMTRELPAGCVTREFRVVAESSLVGIRQLCTHDA